MEERRVFAGARPKTFGVRMEMNSVTSWNTEELLKELLNIDEHRYSQGHYFLTELLTRLEKEPISTENTSLLIQGFSRLCSISPRQQLAKLLQTFADNRKLRTELSKYITNISNLEINNVLEFMNSLIEVLEQTCEVLPTYSLNTIVVLVSLLINPIETNPSFDSMKPRLQSLQEKQNDITKSVRENNTKMPKIREPPNSFRSIDVIPNASDILIDAHPFLRKNLIYGAYMDTEHYLDVQFRLLREDFLIPLRNAVRQYKEEHESGTRSSFLQDARLYTGVHFLGMECKNDGIARKIRFDMTNLTRVKWEYSKRLMNGSLVCLSADKFQSVAFGVISDREPDNLAEGITYVNFDQNTNELVGTNPFQEYDMIESVAYYESYQHNLLALKEIQECDMPMKKYILNQTAVKNTDETPLYLIDEDAQYDMRCLLQNNKTVTKTKTLDPDLQSEILSALADKQKEVDSAKSVNVIDTDNWPTSDEMGLDISQYDALKCALTKEFSIIQGPPGTGKTYLGLKILQVLLENKKVWSPDTTPKLLIACYTNHALDQFLSGILDMFPFMGRDSTLIRIGGHRKSEQRILNCNLKDKVKSREHTRTDRLLNIKRGIDEKIADVSRLLSAVVTGVVNEKQIDMFIGTRNMQSLVKQYKYFPHTFQKTSILLLWLTMAEKPNYRPMLTQSKAKQKQTNAKSKETDQQMVVEELDDNEDIQRIMADGIEVFNKTKPKTRKVYSKDFADTLVVTYDDVIEDKFVNHPLFQNRSHVMDILKRQLISSEHMSVKVAKQVQSYQLWKMQETERWRLYRYWLLQYYEMKRNSMRELCQEYEEAVKQHNDQKRRNEIDVLKKANVIGITTTGAAKYRDLIAAVKPRIFMIEEAAEILEAHIITTLTPSCEHLILIGDHQQLRPNPTAYTLAKEFHLDISLFERMVKNELHLNRLSVQHRMRPEISRLLVPHIYKDLEDHPFVHSYPHIKGIQGDIYFINHTEYETQDEESRSHSNIHEARFAVALCRYLIRQGYNADEITILTTYKGQQFLIKDTMKEIDVYMKKHEVWSQDRYENQAKLRESDQDVEEQNFVRVATVDNFQGEENNIIILSLVRSNEKGSIGFLKMSNRICVALSRAKSGFYAIGNMGQLAKNSKKWNEILSDDNIKDLVVSDIALVCQNHPLTEVRVNQSDDFTQVPEGGCNLQCDYRLPCGHVCILVCHPYDQEHSTTVCRKPCTQVCVNDHPCGNQCYQCFDKTIVPHKHTCVPCDVRVTREMPECKHGQSMKCHVNVDEHICEVPCEKLLRCEHRCQKKCGENCTLKCNISVQEKLPCGHEATKPCHVEKELIKCDVIVSKQLPCGHEAQAKCCISRSDVKCKTKIEIQTCEVHYIETECFKEEQIKNSPCTFLVGMTCPSNSDHKYKVQCQDIAAETKCNKICDFVLKCGHGCSGNCGKCYVNKSHEKCKMQCKHVLPCEHKCKGVCGECQLQGQHLVCSFPTRRILECGHISQSFCGYLPSKCMSSCGALCHHRSCDKRCGEGCEPCKKPCAWQCIHFKCYNACHEVCQRRRCNERCQSRLHCGHQCQGFCGEPCLQSCFECQREHFIEVAKMLGYFVRRPWGFVRLQPCNHNIQGFFMDTYVQRKMRTLQKFNAISFLKCPLCDTAVRFCPRYSSDIKILELKMASVKELQSTEHNRLDWLFKVIETTKDFSLTQSLLMPTEDDLIQCGILCVLQAILNEYDNLEVKIIRKEISEQTKPTWRQANVDYICDVSKSEISLSRKSVKEIVKGAKHHPQPKKLLVQSLEMLFRAKLTALDMFISHQVKRVQIARMARKLHNLDTLDDDEMHEKVCILDDVSQIFEEEFTLKQKGDVRSLMRQVKHCFTPILLIPPGQHYKWILCTNDRIHYLPENQNVNKWSETGTCIVCESQIYPEDIFYFNRKNACVSDYSSKPLEPLSKWAFKRLQFFGSFQQATSEVIDCEVVSVQSEDDENNVSEKKGHAEGNKNEIKRENKNWRNKSKKTQKYNKDKRENENRKEGPVFKGSGSKAEHELDVAVDIQRRKTHIVNEGREWVNSNRSATILQKKINQSFAKGIPTSTYGKSKSHEKGKKIIAMSMKKRENIMDGPNKTTCNTDIKMEGWQIIRKDDIEVKSANNNTDLGKGTHTKKKSEEKDKMTDGPVKKEDKMTKQKSADNRHARRDVRKPADCKQITQDKHGKIDKYKGHVKPPKNPGKINKEIDMKRSSMNHIQSTRKLKVLPVHEDKQKTPVDNEHCKRMVVSEDGKKIIDKLEEKNLSVKSEIDGSGAKRNIGERTVKNAFAKQK